MKHNLMIGEYLQVFKQNTWYCGMDNNSNYDLVVKDVISQFFPPKALQRQKRYLPRGLYKTRDINIREFIFAIDEIIKHLEKFPLFEANQGFPKYEILELA